MFKRSIFPLFLFAFPLFLAAQPKIQLANWANGFTRPVDIEHCNDSRMFVVQQAGIIWVLDSLGNKLDTFLNIDPRVNSTGNEQGLLGLAFHPHYAENGYFFVYYIKNSTGASQVSRFSVKPGSPNEADPDSEFPIFTTAQPYANHNGGCLKFGPDGYLYLGLGDGGSGGDPQGNGQKKNTFLGKMLRFDIDHSTATTAYAIPPDNPFVDQPAYFPEIWALGLRNPWRYSFDRLTGDMWIGDVGQVAREEVDFQPAGKGGRNYGWNCYEGLIPYTNPTSGCQPASAYVSPVFSYVNPSVGCSMTGGFIYRGAKYPDLYGVYLNADYCSGRIWATTRPTDSTFTTVELANLGDNEFSSFGEDRDGELYIALLASGKVQKITELCSQFQVSATSIISPVCYNSFSGLIELSPANSTGTVSYAWSNGQTDHINAYLDPGTYTVTVTNGNGCSRIQTYEIAQLGPGLPTLTASDTLLCYGQNATLTASGLSIPNHLNWYNAGGLIQTTTSSEPNYSITVTGAGDYYVVSADSICFLTSQPVHIEVENSVDPFVGVSGDTIFGGCNICQWLFNNDPIPGATANFYVATQSGVYELESTSPNGCTSQSSGVTITISESPTPASVQFFSVSPNPTAGTMLMKMELTKSEHFTISMTDSSQRQYFSQMHQTDKISLPIDLRSLPAGTYFLHVQLESGSFVRKLVKR